MGEDKEERTNLPGRTDRIHDVTGELERPASGGELRECSTKGRRSGRSSRRQDAGRDLECVWTDAASQTGDCAADTGATLLDRAAVPATAGGDPQVGEDVNRTRRALSLTPRVIEVDRERAAGGAGRSGFDSTSLQR